MKTEAEQYSQFLGSDQLQDGPLQEAAAGAGNGREDEGSSSRRSLVKTQATKQHQQTCDGMDQQR